MPSLTPAPKSPHTSDPILAAFLGPTFDPTAYLNNNLPSLAIPTSTQPVIPSKSLSLPDLTTRTQTHIAQLSAQTARLSATLTELTDAILRSGPRLAYSVELLRGEANALAETMGDTLTEEVETFIPGGLAALDIKDDERENGDVNTKEKGNGGQPGPSDQVVSEGTPNEPPSLARLRTLHHVRTQLQSVINTFDAALSWPLPPSSLSISTSLVSVSAPNASLEAQGQAAQTALKDSVMELLSPMGKSAGAEGVLKAEERIRELRALVEVWKGTGEEKARGKFVDGLERVVEERRREVEKEGGMTKDGERDGESGKKGGFLGGFRRLRDEIYLE